MWFEVRILQLESLPLTLLVVFQKGRSPGEGHGNPLQCSCLEKPMDRGAWKATVHGAMKSQTWLSDWTTLGCPRSLHIKSFSLPSPLGCHVYHRLNYHMVGTSLGVQWLRIHLAMQEMQVPSLLGELRSHMSQLESPCTTANDIPHDATEIRCWASKPPRMQIHKYFQKLSYGHKGKAWQGNLSPIQFWSGAMPS